MAVYHDNIKEKSTIMQKIKHKRVNLLNKITTIPQGMYKTVIIM